MVRSYFAIRRRGQRGRVKTLRVWLGVMPFAALIFSGHLRAASPAHQRDAKAVEIARAMMEAMGGEAAWNSVQFVRFDFKVKVGGKWVENNAHLWDRKNGRYRLERKTKEGKQEVVLFKIGDYQRDKSGAAYLDGKKLESGPAKKNLEDAYASYINDMWWLAMPWKWMDSGVNLKYLGPQKLGDETCDVVELTFDHVGLTPGDMYHAFVSQKSHLMKHWEYVLEGGEKGAWDWQYGDYQGVKLASNHPSSDGKMSIHMGQVRVLDRVDDAFFADPSRMLSGLK